MRILFSPQRREVSLSVIKFDDVLSINGERFDFTPLMEGDQLPASAIDSGFFAGAVERINGELHLTLVLPHGPNPPQHVAFPEPLIDVPDGPVDLPQ